MHAVRRAVSRWQMAVGVSRSPTVYMVDGACRLGGKPSVSMGYSKKARRRRDCHIHVLCRLPRQHAGDAFSPLRLVHHRISVHLQPPHHAAVDATLAAPRGRPSPSPSPGWMPQQMAAQSGARPRLRLTGHWRPIVHPIWLQQSPAYALDHWVGAI